MHPKCMILMFRELKNLYGIVSGNVSVDTFSGSLEDRYPLHAIGAFVDSAISFVDQLK